MSTFGAVAPRHSPWPELPKRTSVTESVRVHVEALQVRTGVAKNLDRAVLHLVSELRGRAWRVQHVRVRGYRLERACSTSP